LKDAVKRSTEETLAMERKLNVAKNKVSNKEKENSD
jgi:hypothetical protein